MHKLAAYLSFALLFFLLPAKAQVPDTIAISPQAARVDLYPAHPVSFPGGVTGLPDIVYASYSGYRPLTLDLYLPPRHDKPVPLVIYIHGGSLKSSDSRFIIGITDVPATLAALAAHGYVVASLNYRLRNEALFPAQVQDIKAAILYLRSHAARHGIDPARVLVWGASSGGQLAALTAMSCGKAEFAPKPSNGRPLLADVAAVAPVSDCVQGVVSWYGDLELSQQAKDPDVWAQLGCNPCTALQIAAADPMTYAASTTPPMLIVHGTADRGVSISQSQNMARRLAELNVPVETYYIPDVDHGFVGKTPQITRAANDKALRRTWDFIDKIFSTARRP